MTHFPAQCRATGNDRNQTGNEDGKSEEDREDDTTADIFRAGTRQQKSARQRCQRNDDGQNAKEVFHVLRQLAPYAPRWRARL